MRGTAFPERDAPTISPHEPEHRIHQRFFGRVSQPGRFHPVTIKRHFARAYLLVFRKASEPKPRIRERHKDAMNQLNVSLQHSIVILAADGWSARRIARELGIPGAALTEMFGGQVNCST